MATSTPVPTPLSYQQILGNSINQLLVKLGLSNLKVGGSLLSILETVSASQARTNNDIIQLLSSLDIDNATGQLLLDIGADAGLSLNPATYARATDLVITDTSFTPILSTVYQGFAAPIAGSTTIYIVTNTNFPATGRIYIGTGTANYEGPLSYSSITNSGTGYSTITLNSPTVNFHNLGETVTLGQGGARNINAGTTCSTQPNNNVAVTQYSILNNYVIPDGQNTLSGIAVIALTPGTVGNAGANSITYFYSAPFTGAAINNPTSIENAQNQETEDDFRQRIKNARASASLGTPLAIISGVIGATAPDESSTVVSANIVPDPINTLYIDDGTGYEEKSSPIGLETIYVDPSGGTQYVALSGGTPIAKAFVQTNVIEPFALVNGAELRVSVNGTAYSVYFNTSQFQNIAAATAFEVITAINSNSSAPYLARVCNNGLSVAIQAKADTNENVQIVPALGTIDANLYLQFPFSKTYTLDLYKNDRLLNKDGTLAQIYSQSQSLWNNGIQAGDTLYISVDGTASQTITLANSDFINAGYTSVSATAPLSVWATVFNAKIAGITTTAQNGQLLLTSNAGPINRAAISITGGTLISKGMFTVQSVAGAVSDYTLNRNTDNISLTVPLNAGDTLSAGSQYTRSYIQSSSFSTGTVGSTAANQWWVVDGATTVLQTGVSSSTVVTFTNDTADNSLALIFSGTPFPASFVDGSWVILWDPAFATVGSANTDIRGFYQVYDTNSGGFSIRVPVLPTSPSNITLTYNGFIALNTNGRIQNFNLAIGTVYNPATLVTALKSQLSGVNVYQLNPSLIRVATQTWNSFGQIALVGGDVEGSKLPFTPNILTNQAYHFGFVESGSVKGTPEFNWLVSSSNSSTNTVNIQATTAANQQSYVGLQSHYWNPILPGDINLRNSGKHRYNYIYSIPTTTSLTLDKTPTVEIIINDNLFIGNPYVFNPTDIFGLVFDGNTTSKSYSVQMGYAVKPLSVSGGVGWYQANNYVTNLDGSSLNNQFGTTFDFTQFKIFAKARTYLGYPAQGASASSGILFRSKQFGLASGILYNPSLSYSANTYVQYINPTAPSSPVSVTGGFETNTSGSEATNGYVINISLPSTAIRSGSVSAPSWNAQYQSVAGPSGSIVYLSGVTVAYSAGASSTTITTSGGIFPDQTTPPTSRHNFPVSGLNCYVYPVSGTVFTPVAGTISNPSGTGNSTGWTITTVTPISSSAASGVIKVVIIPTISYVPTAAPSMGAALGTNEPAIFSLYGTGTFTYQTSILNNAYRVYQLDATDGLWCRVLLNSTDASSVGSTSGWYSVQNGTSSIYDIDTTQTSPATLATTINGLASNLWITATYPTWSVGSTPVSWASKDIYYFNAAGFANSGGVDLGKLTGGEYFITSSTYGGNVSAPTAYQFQSSNFTTNQYAAITSPTTNEDWGNEQAYLVPTSLRSVQSYLSNLSVCGISNAGNIDTGDDNFKLNISTKTIGSAGSVQVSPSTANQSSTNVINYATQQLSGSYTTTEFEIPTANAGGFKVNQWVSLQNTQLIPANLGVDLGIDGTTVIQITNPTSTTSQLHISSGDGAWVVYTPSSAGFNNRNWAIIKYGIYAAYILLGATGSDSFGGASDFNVFYFNQSGGPSSNNGYFQVISTINTEAGTPPKNVVFVINPNAVEGIYSGTTPAPNTAWFQGLASVQPGSQISAFGGVLGNGASNVNNGVFTVTQVVNASTIIVNGALTPLTTTLGNVNYQNLFSVLPPQPYRFIQKISYLQPSATDAGYTQVGLASPYIWQWISGSSNQGGAGTVMSALDKLNFPTTINSGIDAYRVNTGLIAQCNKIIYGDPADNVTYPGILADGNNININGPIVTNISVTLAIRIVQGIQTNVVPQVQNAVANLINTNPIGNPIALSSIIDAASNIPGVESVVMISPALTESTDTISIQPFEKSIVTNTNNIGVSVLYP